MQFLSVGVGMAQTIISAWKFRENTLLERIRETDMGSVKNKIRGHVWPLESGHVWPLESCLRPKSSGHVWPLEIITSYRPEAACFQELPVFDILITQTLPPAAIGGRIYNITRHQMILELPGQAGAGRAGLGWANLFNSKQSKWRP